MGVFLPVISVWGEHSLNRQPKLRDFAFQAPAKGELDWRQEKTRKIEAFCRDQKWGRHARLERQF